MDLTVIGCSGSVPGPDSPASCYLVQAPHAGSTFSLLLDLGPGALGALYRYLEPSAIDAVALSHLHPDHCLDLCALYVTAAYSSTEPFRRLPVYGPPGTSARIKRAYDAPPPRNGQAEESKLDERFNFVDWSAEQDIGPFTVQTAEVAHPTLAYAVRVTEVSTGAVLVYSGDTGPCVALTDLARSADLLLIESSFLDEPDNPPGMHLSGREAAVTATEAGVGTVVITHIPPWRNLDQIIGEARPHFSGPLSAARSGDRWRIEATRSAANLTR